MLLIINQEIFKYITIKKCINSRKYLIIDVINVLQNNLWFMSYKHFYYNFKTICLQNIIILGVNFA